MLTPIDRARLPVSHGGRVAPAWAASVGSVVAVLVVWLQYRFLVDTPYRVIAVACVPAVLATAYLSGLRAGLIVTAVTALALALIRVGPGPTILSSAVHDQLRWILLTGVNVAVCATCEALHATRRAIATVLEKEQARREMLATLIAHAPLVLFSFRRAPDGAMTLPFVSPSLGGLFGLELASLRVHPETLLARIHPDDRTALVAAIGSGAQAPAATQFRVEHPTRGTVLVEACTNAHRHDDGSITWHGFLRDITEPMRQRAAVAESQERLRALVETTHNAIVSVDERLAVILFNPAAERLFGIAADAVLGEPAARLLPDDGGARLGAMFEQIRDASERWRERSAQELITRDAGGSTRVLEIALSRAELDGHPVVTAILRDVSDRRRAEEELRRSEHRFETAFRSSPLAMSISRGEDGELVEVNDAFCRLLEYPRDELLGARSIELGIWKPGQRTPLVAAMRTRGAVHDWPSTLTARGGRPVPVRVSCDTIEIEGAPHYLATLVDVSASERAEQARAESEARFQQLAEVVPQVFWMIDALTREILYVSPAFDTVWGRPRATLRASTDAWIDGVHPEDRARVSAAAKSQQLAGTYDVTYRVVRPDGTIRIVRDRASVLRDADGTAIRIAGLAEDVTERQQLEAELQQTQKMESVGRLAGGVAHDFNNMLTVVMAASAELRAELTAPSVLELLDEIDDAAGRGATLTSQLLAFSRRQVVEARVLNINAVIGDAEKMLRRLLGEDVTLSTALAPTIHAVRVDPGHLTQVLMNLAVNARDAMPDGGRLTITTTEVTLPDGALIAGRVAHGGAYVRIDVTDTGCGMPPEVASRVFEPFFTTKGAGRGTGLGLSVIDGIVAQSGGLIDLRTAPGEGATFTIYLPVAHPRATSVTAARPVAHVGGSETVLVVEDQDALRRGVARALRSAGYRILEAADGDSALAVLGTTPRVDLMITDVVMPGMNGRELATMATARYPELRVIYTSGYTDDEVVRSGLQQADVVFLQKPYEPRTLLGKVREVLDAAPAP